MKTLRNETADIGVGTLIIFIAMVLVAAVAATLLIYTTGALQQKAIKTSTEAVTQVSSNIVVVNVIGDRVNSTVPGIQPGIQGFIIRIKPDVGTTSIYLRQLLIIEIASYYRWDLNYSNIERLGSYGVYDIVRDDDGSFNVDTPVLNSGDLVDIAYHTTNYTCPLLMPRQTITLSLNQELGASVNLEITAPNSFGVNRYIELYP